MAAAMRSNTPMNSILTPHDTEARQQTSLLQRLARVNRAVVVLAAGTSLMLAGCTSSTKPTGSPQPTQSIPPLAAQHCGTIKMGPGISSTSPTAETCFASAFEHCQSTDLVVDTNAVDVGDETRYTIAGAPCHIIGVRNGFAAPSPGALPPVLFTCSGMTLDANGLTMTGCNDPSPLSHGAPPLDSPTASAAPTS